MISICIPIYNRDVTQLVNKLSEQATSVGIIHEILLLDDCSTSLDTKEKNRVLANKQTIFSYENESNRGLAYTRNRLGQLAKYSYLLFIDSDALVVKSDYLSTYTKYCQPKVVCFGGCVYTQEYPDPKFLLRWKFGKKREEGIGKYYSCFNFLIDRELFNQNPFSDKLNQYGYEDTLFGILLKQKGLDILFVDNPMLHDGLEPAAEYLKKVNKSVQNLLQIEDVLKLQKVEEEIKILRIYKKIERLKLKHFITFVFSLTKKVCINNLTGENPKLWVLDFYKIGYLCNLKTKN